LRGGRELNKGVKRGNHGRMDREGKLISRKAKDGHPYRGEHSFLKGWGGGSKNRQKKRENKYKEGKKRVTRGD